MWGFTRMYTHCWIELEILIIISDASFDLLMLGLVQYPRKLCETTWLVAESPIQQCGLYDDRQKSCLSNKNLIFYLFYTFAQQKSLQFTFYTLFFRLSSYYLTSDYNCKIMMVVILKDKFCGQVLLAIYLLIYFVPELSVS